MDVWTKYEREAVLICSLRTLRYYFLFSSYAGRNFFRVVHSRTFFWAVFVFLVGYC
jgi:hypothetical protein